MEAPLKILGPISPEQERALSREAFRFVAALAAEFEPRRRELLERRAERWTRLDRGENPDFLPETRDIREGDWQVAPAPADLDRRLVEITGPADRKMMINALNSGADVFMVDFEDAFAPTWDNVVQGQINCIDAVTGEIDYQGPDGREYRLDDEVATLMVRPRGWHLTEKHVLVDGRPVSASLFDFGVFFFNNARRLIARGSGPYFYLPKLESHHEARLWNDVFEFAQDRLGIPRGTIRATVLIETIMAAFEMEEILYALKDHSAGLNAGRWDYIFSVIRKFRARDDFVLPDRSQITMTVPFMRAYTELLVRTCHTRGAHAIGGMAAFIPSRRDEEVNERAFTGVRADKQRESEDGFDGTWVAHPDLVEVARGPFARHLGDRPHQKSRTREDVSVGASDLLEFRVDGGAVTEAGLRLNVNVALQYLSAWLAGLGAVGIYNLMEDTATAEISRSQLWQWVHHRAVLDDGREVGPDLYRTIRSEEAESLRAIDNGKLDDATALLDELVLSDTFVEFLTLRAYDHLVAETEARS